MIRSPLLTIVVTTYKRDVFLKLALSKILEQNYDSLEIIVIDDNPNQNSNSTEKVVNEFVGGNNAQIKYIKNKKNIGISNAHKLGFSEAQGKYIVFHDDDDYYTNAEWLTKAVNIMVADPELAFVGARSFAFTENEKREDNLSCFGKINSKEYLKNFTTIGKPLSTFAAVFDTSKLEAANFNNMLISNDTTIYLRALLCGGGYLLNEYIGMYRVHKNSLTKTIDADTLLLHIDEKELILSELKWNSSEKNDFYFNQSKMNLGYYILRNANPNYRKVFGWINKKPRKTRNKLRLIVIKFIAKKFMYQFIKIK